VLGLHFSEKELGLMLPDVLERLKEFERLRAVPLANEVAPALLFAPLPEMLGRPSSDEHERPHWSGPFPGRPEDLEELAFQPLWVLEEHLVRRQVSCVELTRMFLGRLERLDEKLHCVVTLTEDRALAQAAAHG
jgi:hypothetical protein